MTTEDQLRCERECSRLCHDFAWSVDRGDYDAFVALFAPDGVFDRVGTLSRGHAGIRAFLDARPSDRVTRHACSNVRAVITGPDTATGGCMALMFHATAQQPAQLPLPVSQPVVVDYDDEYVLTPDGWKFKYRKTTIVFQP